MNKINDALMHTQVYISGENHDYYMKTFIFQIQSYLRELFVHWITEAIDLSQDMYGIDMLPDMNGIDLSQDMYSIDLSPDMHGIDLSQDMIGIDTLCHRLL